MINLIKKWINSLKYRTIKITIMGNYGTIIPAGTHFSSIGQKFVSLKKAKIPKSGIVEIKVKIIKDGR